MLLGKAPAVKSMAVVRVLDAGETLPSPTSSPWNRGNDRTCQGLAVGVTRAHACLTNAATRQPLTPRGPVLRKQWRPGPQGPLPRPGSYAPPLGDILVTLPSRQVGAHTAAGSRDAAGNRSEWGRLGHFSLPRCAELLLLGKADPWGAHCLISKPRCERGAEEGRNLDSPGTRVTWAVVAQSPSDVPPSGRRAFLVNRACHSSPHEDGVDSVAEGGGDFSVGLGGRGSRCLARCSRRPTAHCTGVVGATRSDAL